MGFGLLFIGYFVTYVMSYVFIPKLLGCILMLLGVLKLSAYDLKFKKCIPVLGAMSITSAFMLVNSALQYFNITALVINDVLLNSVSVADELLGLGFHAFLLLAINNIARDTGLEKLCFKAMRNLLLVFVAEIAWFAVLIFSDTSANQVIFWIAIGLRIIWIVLDLILLVSCYRLICDESDVDMPDKEVNIPVIKQMEEIMRRRDKNAFDSGRNWSEKRKAKREEKKNKK